jgi:ribosomal protein S18 acetylase RimI-like enzyme
VSASEPRHPDHEIVATTVRGWFIASTPEIGVFMDETWYGFASRPGSHVGARVILTVDQASRVQEAWHAIADRYGLGPVTVWVDDRDRAERIADALLAAGCREPHDTVFLALLGPVQVDRTAPALVLHGVRDDNDLVQWARVKLQGFSDTDSSPDDEALAREVAVRQAEAAIGHYQLASIDGEPVGILGAYQDQDWMVYNLAVLAQFRHRGIAQAMLTSWAAQGAAAGARSLLINGDDAGRPVALYRRMGFTDEVYWRRTFAAEVKTSTG